MAKPLYYKEEDGTQYKISFSEELQMKNLEVTRENTSWQKRNFYMKVFTALLLLVMVVVLIFVLYQLDKVNFFTVVMGGK